MEDIPLHDDVSSPEQIPDTTSTSTGKMDKKSCRIVRWKRQLGLTTSSGLPDDDQLQYAQLCERHADALLQDEDEENKEAATTESEPSFPDSMDPLTAMAQAAAAATAQQEQLEQQYRRDRARRNRGLDQTSGGIPAEPTDDVAAFRQLIANDVVRLSPVAFPDPPIEALSRILLVFALEEPHMGYLQGMHEIAAFVWTAVTMEQDENGSDSPKSIASIVEATCFTLTRTLLTQISASYDTQPTDNPLTAQSQRIVEYLRPWSALHQRLCDAFVHIPSQLVFTKWMRLLFSREVSTPDLVFPLWDGLFQAAAAQSSCSLQTTIEAMAAARLWQHGEHILRQLSHDDDALLQWFMNIPPETDVQMWIRRMRVLLRQIEEDPSLDTPPVVTAPMGVPPQRVPSLPQQLPSSRGMYVSTTASAQPLGNSGFPPSSSAAMLSSSSSALSSQFSSFTEKLAAQTQSFSNFLSQEWDSLQQQPPPQPVMSQQQQQQQQYNLDYYPRQQLPTSPLHSMQHNSDARRITTATTPEVSSTILSRGSNTAPLHHLPSNASTTNSTTTVSERLQHSILQLQQFAVQVEQQAGVRVPPNVWTALADLSQLQEELLQQQL